MLVDGAKFGDVEIPVFCYEPKLGAPVGACRMCLVEIEGIPKLQTACSTPVKDGMVVHTATARVQAAQQAVVEFLLINHPLDCPVCDKGGECPLQDISFGWGGGTLALHRAQAPLREAARAEPARRDRPRALHPLLPLRALLAGGLRGLPARPGGARRALVRRHVRRAPLRRAVQRQHHRAVPGGRAHLAALPLPRAPVGHRAGAGSVCTLCPAQCNVSFTVRDDRVLRVLARDNAEVDDGWLCDKGRFAYQADARRRAHHAAAAARRRRAAPGHLGARARRGRRRARPRARARRRAGRRRTPRTRRASSCSAWCARALGSGDLDSRSLGAAPDATCTARSPRPRCRRPCATSSSPTPCSCSTCEPVDDAPILDLRMRKGVRRQRRQARRGRRAARRRWTPTPRGRCASRPAPARRCSPRWTPPRSARAAHARRGWPTPPAPTGDVRRGAAMRCATRRRGRRHLWRRAAAAGPRGERRRARAAQRRRRARASRGRDGAGLLERARRGERPRPARGRRPAGRRPRPAPSRRPGRGARRDRRGARRRRARRALPAATSTRCATSRTAAPGTRALERATTVVAHAGFLTEGMREHANVVFPAESYAEQEGTVVHPDGRVQRLRPAIGRPGERARRAGRSWPSSPRAWGSTTRRAQRRPMATAQLVEAVPFYAGLTLEEIGGKGVRWQSARRPRRSRAAEPGPFDARGARRGAGANGRLRLGALPLDLGLAARSRSRPR